MADVELVITIPEEIRIAVSETGLLRTPYEMQKSVDRAIQHGTPLPKGHGDLIDKNELIKDRVSNDNIVILANTAKTLIPADME